MGVPIIRTIVFEGLCWGPLIFGNYHMGTAIGFRVWGIFHRYGGTPIGFGLRVVSTHTPITWRIKLENCMEHETESEKLG